MAVLGVSGKSIKSIQRGQTLCYPEAEANVTINSVDTSKSFVVSSDENGWGRQYDGSDGSECNMGVRLSSSTNLNFKAGRAYHMYQWNYSERGTCWWEVVEFE